MTSTLLAPPPDTGRVAPPRLRLLRYEPDPAPLPAAGALSRRPGGVGAAGPGYRPGRRERAAARHTAGPTEPPRPGSAAQRPQRVADSRGTDAERPSGTGAGATAAGERAEQREAHRTAVQLLRTALEVLDGRRPPGQVESRFTPEVLRYWRATAAQRRVRTPARFARLRVCVPRSGVAEVAVTCDVDGRPRALAARLERAGATWRCTALRLM